MSVIDHSAPAHRWRGFAFALPIALLTIVPLLAVVGMAVTPQPDIWLHLWNNVLPRVLGNTLLLMLLVGVAVLGIALNLRTLPLASLPMCWPLCRWASSNMPVRCRALCVM